MNRKREREKDFFDDDDDGFSGNDRFGCKDDRSVCG